MSQKIWDGETKCWKIKTAQQILYKLLGYLATGE